MLMAVFVSAMGIKFGLGTLRYPGPGFFPFLVGLILFFLSLAIISPALKQRKKDAHFAEWPHLSGRVFPTMAILFAYGCVLEYSGYILGSFLVMFYLFKVPGEQKWWFSTLVTAITVALTYYIFGVLLQAQFPKGIWDLG